MVVHAPPPTTMALTPACPTVPRTTAQLQQFTPLEPPPSLTMPSLAMGAPPPPLPSLNSLFGEEGIDKRLTIGLQMQLSDTQAGLGFVYNDLQKLRMQGNNTFQAFEQRMLEAHAAQMTQLQLNHEVVEGAFRVLEHTIGAVNTTLHSHHNRHQEVEQGLVHLHNILMQVQDDQGQAAVRVMN